MIIGNLTYDRAQDTYTGELATLTVAGRALVFQPNEAKGEKGRREPNYRVTSPAQGGDIELGGAWKKYTNDGREYLSVTLADPALAQSVNCALLGSGDTGEQFILVWSRDTRKTKAA
jgi:uncharacterized protein (DUF736 family)